MIRHFFSSKQTHITCSANELNLGTVGVRGVFRPEISSQQTHPKRLRGKPNGEKRHPAVQVRRVSHELRRHEQPPAAPQYEPHQSH